jgi:hypothetical protein
MSRVWNATEFVLVERSKWFNLMMHNSLDEEIKHNFGFPIHLVFQYHHFIFVLLKKKQLHEPFLRQRLPGRYILSLFGLLVADQGKDTSGYFHYV